MKKIFFFVTSTFNKRDYKRFGFEILQSRGYEVNVLDFTPFLKNKVYENYIPPDIIKYRLHNLIKKQSDFYKVANRLKNSRVICLIGLKSETEFIFNYLKENQISFGFCNLGVMPEIPRPFLDKIQLLFKNPNLIRSKFNSLFSNKNNKELYPDFIISGGEKSYNSNRYPKNNLIRIIEAHTFDYDLYLIEEREKKKPIIHGSYVVFLDSYIPFHPDYLHLNISPYCSAEDYYPNLNRFFDKIESMFNTRVVIAAHPRSNYNNKENLFDNRVCIKNEIANLVKHSKFVINHVSTAINFSVLYKKPVLFILSSKYSSRYYSAIQFFAKLFNNKTINIDNNKSSVNLILKIDEDIYEDYKQKYIKASKTLDKPLWEIFSDYLL